MDGFTNLWYRSRPIKMSGWISPTSRTPSANPRAPKYSNRSSRTSLQRIGAQITGTSVTRRGWFLLVPTKSSGNTFLNSHLPDSLLPNGAYESIWDSTHLGSTLRTSALDMWDLSQPVSSKMVTSSTTRPPRTVIRNVCNKTRYRFCVVAPSTERLAELWAVAVPDLTDVSLFSLTGTLLWPVEISDTLSSRVSYGCPLSPCLALSPRKQRTQWWHPLQRAHVEAQPRAIWPFPKHL